MDRTATAPSAQPADTSRMDRSVMARATEVPDEASRARRESHERHCHIKLEWRVFLRRTTLKILPFQPYSASIDVGWAAQEEPA